MSKFRTFDEHGKRYEFDSQSFSNELKKYQYSHKNNRYTLMKLFMEIGEKLSMSQDSINAYYRGLNGPGSLETVKGIGNFLNIDYHCLLKEIATTNVKVEKDDKIMDEKTMHIEEDTNDNGYMNIEKSIRGALNEVFCWFKKGLDEFVRHHDFDDDYQNKLNELDENDEKNEVQLFNEYIGTHFMEAEYISKANETLEKYFLIINEAAYNNIRTLFNRFGKYAVDSWNYSWGEYGITRIHLDSSEDEFGIIDESKDKADFEEFCEFEYGCKGDDVMDGYAAIARFYKMKYMQEFKTIFNSCIK